MEGQVYDQNHATMQPILGRLRQMVNLAVIAAGFFPLPVCDDAKSASSGKISACRMVGKWAVCGRMRV
jgi:hypothetical protein